MTLIVEDGSNVAGANSYSDLVGIRAYASARGVTLSDDDSVLEPLAFQAMDYIEAKRKDFQGKKTNYVGADGSLPIPQPLQWPRCGVFIDDEPFSQYAIPVELVNAQCQLCIEFTNGIDAMPTIAGPFVTSEQVDVLKTTYSETIGTGAPTMQKVDALLSVLLRDDSGFVLTTVRL